MISLSPVLPCMTCTWLKPQLYSFEIRFHCTSFPVSILQGQIFMSCRLPSLHIPSSGKCARLFLNPGHFVSGHARPPTHVPMVGGEVHMQPQARMSRMSNYVEHGL